MCHVLIIEDETLVAMDIQNVLIEEGATSFAFAGSQVEAIEEATARLPHVITSDVRLSSGTGPLAVRAIRERFGLIPVMFISGNPDDCTPRELDDPVFGKPFDRARVATEFRRILTAFAGNAAVLGIGAPYLRC